MNTVITRAGLQAGTNARTNALRAIAKLTKIDLLAATKSKRHNPILDSEIHIEEELINLKESVDSLYTAGDTLQEYPQMYHYVTRERRAITKHCIGLIVRMMHGLALPQPYTKADVDEAIARLVQLVVQEMRRAGKQIDDDILEVFRPFLTVRQRVQLRDFNMDLLMQMSQIHRARTLAQKFSMPRPR